MSFPIPDNTVKDILIFDLDNYIGRAVNKKDEIIIARNNQKIAEEQNDDAKSFYYPPEEDDEPQELIEIAEQVKKELEINKKIFGIPAFKHTSAFRSIDGIGTWEEWLAPARPLDKSHRIDTSVIDSLITCKIFAERLYEMMGWDTLWNATTWGGGSFLCLRLHFLRCGCIFHNSITKGYNRLKAVPFLSICNYHYNP